MFKNKYLEYHHGDWKRGPAKVFVTLETVIPALPKKPLEKPDEAKFTKAQEAIEKDIKDLRAKMDDQSKKFKEKLDQFSSNKNQ